MKELEVRIKVPDEVKVVVSCGNLKGRVLEFKPNESDKEHGNFFEGDASLNLFSSGSNEVLCPYGEEEKLYRKIFDRASVKDGEYVRELKYSLVRESF